MKSRRKPLKYHRVNNRPQWKSSLKTFCYGEPPKLTGHKAITGILSNPSIKAKVTKRISAILKIASEIKIGVTGDTTIRMDSRGYRQRFEFVSRIYKTTSKEIARNYEVELIKKFKRIYPKKVLNISASKAGRLTTYNGFYYIYVVYNLM